jgi:Arv1-like family
VNYVFALFAQSTWKLALIFLLCDAYIKWDNMEARRGRHDNDERIFYAALEWDIYTVFLISMLGLVFFLSLSTSFE